MRRKTWSNYERAQVRAVTQALCKNLGLDPKEPEYQNIGWEGFLEAYEREKSSFCRGTGERGWRAAAELMDQRLRAAKAERDFLLYQAVSLDAPVEEDSDTPRWDLFRGKQGDFQMSVCFRSYLEDLDDWSHDAKLLAFALSNGDTLDEVRQDHDWDRDRADKAMEVVRLAMMEYLEI